jgi:hypothetical protein
LGTTPRRALGTAASDAGWILTGVGFSVRR